MVSLVLDIVSNDDKDADGTNVDDAKDIDNDDHNSNNTNNNMNINTNTNNYKNYDNTI